MGPEGGVLVLVIVAVIWIPIRRSRLGLSFYAIGSNPAGGVPERRLRRPDEDRRLHALTGLFAALGGLSLTGSTGIGTPVPGSATRC